MALRAPIVFPSLLFKHDDRTSPALVDNFRRHFRALYQWLSDHDALVAVNQPNVAQFQGAADLAWKAFNLDERSVLDPILLAACFNDRIHECLPP